MKKNVFNIVLFVTAILVVFIAWFLFFQRAENPSAIRNEKKQSSNNAQTLASDNVRVENGKQIITINVKGGYFPKKTEAKSGIPTVIRMNTRGTFDCSSALTIPDMDYQKNLPPSGETDIDVPSQNPGTTIQGLCSMGMYGFSVSFK